MAILLNLVKSGAYTTASNHVVIRWNGLIIFNPIFIVHNLLYSVLVNIIRDACFLRLYSLAQLFLFS